MLDLSQTLEHGRLSRRTDLQKQGLFWNPQNVAQLSPLNLVHQFLRVRMGRGGRGYYYY